MVSRTNHMRRVWSSFVLCSIVLFLSACGGSDPSNSESTADTQDTVTESDTSNGTENSTNSTDEPNLDSSSTSENTLPNFSNQYLIASVDSALTIIMGPTNDTDGDVLEYTVSPSSQVQTTAFANQIIYLSDELNTELLTINVSDGINDPTTFNIEVVTTPADGNLYYLSENGNDQNDGSSLELAWATFAKAWTILQPGDTLIVDDGTYDETLMPTVSGEAGNPITIMAKNRGQATIQKTVDGPAISVMSDNSQTISHITIDGFVARGKGEYSAIIVNSSDNIAENQMTNNIIIRNSGAFGSANLQNVVIFAIARTRDSLFEDMWAYGFGRKAIQIYGSTRVTARRIIARYDYWDGSGYKPNDPRIGFAIYNSNDGIYENIIVLDNAPDPVGRNSASKAGYAIEGNVTTTATFVGAKGNGWYGCLSLDNDRNGLYSSGISTGTNDNNTIENFISWGNYNGMVIHAYTTNTQIVSGTLGQSTNVGVRINNDNVSDTLFDKQFATNNVSFPFFIAGQGGFYGANTTFQNNTAINNGSGADIEASFAPTLNYLVSPTMVDGKERGGVIVNRYEDGVLTDVPLWPWPNEAIIREHMCNSEDLTNTNRVAANGAGWAPKWCESGKSLTNYVWEYLGNTIPTGIYP